LDIERTAWLTVCSSAPHSQAAEVAIPHLYKQERKRLTLVRRRLSQTKAILGRAAQEGGAGVRYENAEFCGVVCLLRITLVLRPVHRMYVVVVDASLMAGQ